MPIHSSERMHPEQALSQQALHMQLSRREFMKIVTATGITTMQLTLLDNYYTRKDMGMTKEPAQFSPSQIGYNINRANISWLVGNTHREVETIVKQIMDMPGENVRIPLPFHEVMADPKHPHFETIDWVIDMAIAKGKQVHLQMGIKTFNWPEVHIPAWMYEKYPALRGPGAVDQLAPIKPIVMEYLQACRERYLTNNMYKDTITSIQVDNEAFSKRLPVTDKFVSPAFNKEELELIKIGDPFHRPILQNIPWDTPEHIPHVFQTSDIVGFNVYNQYQHHAWLPLSLLWPALRMAKVAADVFGKEFWIPEYQAGAWLNGDKKPVYPYSLEAFNQGLHKVKQLNPKKIFFWAAELHIAAKDKEHLSRLHSMAA